MNAFSPEREFLKWPKAKKQPKPKANPYDNGTAAERMARHAQPLPTERKKAPNRPSTM